uniref:Uncharacterized protein n=1 Tax=Ditylenchus dipsaci TaxID=166011 RepID=A0A915CT37_9BILA
MYNSLDPQQYQGSAQQFQNVPSDHFYPPGTIFQFPSRWIMQQSWLWSDMNIKDEWGNKVFHAENQIFSIGYKLNFTDVRTGEEIAYIQQRIHLGMPKFTIFVRGAEYGVVHQKFTFLTKKFSIDTVNGPLSVSGDWTAHSFVFNRGQQLVATASREFFAIRDTYAVEIQPGEDVIFILACCIVIDKCMTEN